MLTTEKLKPQDWHYMTHDQRYLEQSRGTGACCLWSHQTTSCLSFTLSSATFCTHPEHTAQTWEIHPGLPTEEQRSEHSQTAHLALSPGDERDKTRGILDKQFHFILCVIHYPSVLAHIIQGKESWDINRNVPQADNEFQKGIGSLGHCGLKDKGNWIERGAIIFLK